MTFQEHQRLEDQFLNVDFGTGGAFPEYNVAQYPQGFGKPVGAILNVSTDSHQGQIIATAPAGSSVTTASSLPSGRLVEQTASSALHPHTFTSEQLAQPSSAVLKAQEEATAEALALTTQAQEETQQVLAKGIFHSNTRQMPRLTQLTAQTGQVRTAAIIDAPRDPLDPRGIRRRKLQRHEYSGASGPSRRLQSPPRDPLDHTTDANNSIFNNTSSSQQWEAAMHQWTGNPKSRLIPLETRAAYARAQHEADPTRVLDQETLSYQRRLRAALRQAETEVQTEVRAAEEAQKAKKEADEEARRVKAEAEAMQALRKRNRERLDQRDPDPDEPTDTAIQRHQHSSRWREDRERMAEERRRQRRWARAATAMGKETSSLDALHQQQPGIVPGDELFSDLNKNASLDEDDALEVDARLAYPVRQEGVDPLYQEGLFGEPITRKDTETHSSKETRVETGVFHHSLDMHRVQAEMMRQKQQQPQENDPQRKPASTEDDIFAIGDLLAKRRTG